MTAVKTCATCISLPDMFLLLQSLMHLTQSICMFMKQAACQRELHSDLFKKVSVKALFLQQICCCVQRCTTLLDVCLIR